MTRAVATDRLVCALPCVCTALPVAPEITRLLQWPQTAFSVSCLVCAASSVYTAFLVRQKGGGGGGRIKPDCRAGRKSGRILGQPQVRLDFWLTDPICRADKATEPIGTPNPSPVKSGGPTHRHQQTRKYLVVWECLYAAHPVSKAWRRGTVLRLWQRSIWHSGAWRHWAHLWVHGGESGGHGPGLGHHETFSTTPATEGAHLHSLPFALAHVTSAHATLALPSIAHIAHLLLALLLLQLLLHRHLLLLLHEHLLLLLLKHVLLKLLLQLLLECL